MSTTTPLRIAIMADLQPQGDRLDAFQEQLDEALGLASARGVTGLAIAGDVFEVANIGDSHAGTGAVIEAVCAPLRHWLGQDQRREVLAIRGNHDADTDALADALAALECIGAPEQVRVERRPAVVHWHGLNVACLPWRWYVADESQTASAELDRLINDLDVDPNVTKLLLAHAPVIGASQGQGRAYQGGGAWALTQEDCLNAGRFFDRVALGDFHLRQPDLCGAGRGGYVGALWQMNFAHCGEPAGFEIWEPSTGLVEWVEVDAAPTHHKYVVERDEDVLELARAGEGTTRRCRVWIVADGFSPSREARAACAAAGVRLSVENVKARVERVARVEAAPVLAAAGDLDGLLVASLGTLSPAPATEKRERVRGLLSRLIEDNPKLLRAGGVDAAAGEPTRASSPVLLAVSMRGIARHAEPVEMNLAAASPLVAVVGRNGAGKTSLVGGLYAALFGTLPGYRGSLYEATTVGGDGEAWVEATFGVVDAATGGLVRYKARRELRVRASGAEQERYLYRLDDAGGEAMIAGPKEGPFRAAVERLVGTAETALATWFLAGSREGDLVELSPSQRRAALGSLMGLDVIEAIAEAAGDEAKARAAQVKLSAASLPSVSEAEAALSAATEREATERARQVETEREIAEARVALETATMDLDAAKDEVARLEGARDKRAALASRRGSLVDAVAAKGERLESAKANLAKAEAALASISGVIGPDVRLASARDKRAKVRAAADHERLVVEARARLSAATEAKDAARARLDEAEAKDAGKPTLDAIKAEGVELGKAVEQAEARARDCETRRRAAANAETTAKASLRASKDTLESLRREAADKPTTPFGDEACAPCPLMARFAGLTRAVAAVEANVESLREAVAKATDQYKAAEAEVEAANAERDRLSAERQALRDRYAARKAEVDAVERLRDAVGTSASAELEAREKLSDAERNRPSDVPDAGAVEREIAGLEAELAAFEATRAEAAKVSNLAALVASLGVEIGKTRDDLASAEADLAALCVVDQSDIDAAVNRRECAGTNRAAARVAVERKTDVARAIASALGSASTAAESARKALDAARAANERHAALVAEESDWRLLALAMGPTGAQGLVIEAASLDFEREASAIVSRLMDRPLTISLAMQALDAKTAKTHGECRLLMAEADGAPAARELAQWSGGERDAAAIAIRVALAQWVAARRSLALRSLFVDEVAARMHPDVAGRLVDLFADSVTDGRLAQVVAITPNPVLAARMPSRVEVSASALGFTTATLREATGR